MAHWVILTTLDGSAEAERILDEFERRTGLRSDRVERGRTYELRNEEHRTQVVRTLNEIDERWTDHVGFRDPA